MKNHSNKYSPFPRAPRLTDRTWPDHTIDTAPIWCSVDLRDGNQALPNPMGIEQKLVFFDALVQVGFKEIEVGFPCSNDTEALFVRKLIDEQRIPDDVTIGVLVPCRKELVQQTFEVLRGAPRAIVHFYNSTNPIQREVTFGKTKEEVKQMAVDTAREIRRMETTCPETRFTYEYSPESFSDTEVDYAVEVCNAVIDEIRPSPQSRMIINLPDTVEVATPNVYADQIEYVCRHIKARDSVIVSLHTHNDRGTGIAATELGLMAGAERVEGTLFGNGERTGNADIVTLALNMHTQGIDTGLDFSNLSALRAMYEQATGMKVDPRHPYSGDLVFTAFSGSHQDAIRKGVHHRARTQIALGNDAPWEIPYVPMDPKDVGANFTNVVRVNGQSGKSGCCFVMEEHYGTKVPLHLASTFGNLVKNESDKSGRELTPEEIRKIYQTLSEVGSAPVLTH